MKLKNVKNIDKLFQTINECSGKVMLVGDDIQLNMKSKLTQYVALAKIFSDGEIPELELHAENPDDVAKLIKFMMEDQE